jgi:hypothetical protein
MTSPRSVATSSCATPIWPIVLYCSSCTAENAKPNVLCGAPVLSHDADEPIEVPDASRARRQAERVARSIGGAVAFSRTGDPTPVVLARFGDVPEDLAEFTGG